MISPRGLAVIPVMIPMVLAGMPCCGQVVRIAGAAENAAGVGSGAALSLYDTDATTTVGAALQQGVHLGVRREVSVGESTLALGDSTVEMPLPSDLENTPRSFQARGLLLRNAQSGTIVFAGFTGAATMNTFLSSVVPSRFFSVVSSQAVLDGCTIGTLVTRGVHNNALLSVSHERNPFWRMAVTAGRSDSHTVLRMLAAAQGASYRLAVSENFGELQLQPSVGQEVASLERIGLNAVVSRSLGRHWIVDGARHSYATANASQSQIYQGVTAARSTLLEGGAMLHAGPVQLQARVLSARSGAQNSQGALATAGWTAQRWSLQATLLQSRVSGVASAVGLGPDRSVNLQAAHQVTTHLQLEGNASIGGNSNSASVGGSWTGDRFGISVNHHQTFVPFGDRSGFRPVVLVSARLRLGGNETSASVTAGAGLPMAVLLSTDGYYGAMQDAALPQQRPARMPRYLLRGHVRTPAGDPLRGAAVRIGATVVYTNSEGEFLARFDRENPLPVRLAPELFLLSEKFQDRSGELVSRPLREGGDLVLTAERCRACAAADQAAGARLDMPLTSPAANRRRSVLARACRRVGLLTVRMFTWREKSRADAA